MKTTEPTGLLHCYPHEGCPCPQRMSRPSHKKKKLRLRGAKLLVRDTSQELTKAGAKPSPHSKAETLPMEGLLSLKMSKHDHPLQCGVPLRLVPHNFTFIGLTSNDRANAMSSGTGAGLSSHPFGGS